MRRFLCFYLILFLVHCNALAMFRMFAALTRDMVVANSVGSCFLVVFLMLSGYIFAQSTQPSSALSFAYFPIKKVSQAVHSLWHVCCFRASQHMLHVMPLKVCALLPHGDDWLAHGIVSGKPLKRVLAGCSGHAARVGVGDLGGPAGIRRAGADRERVCVPALGGALRVCGPGVVHHARPGRAGRAPRPRLQSASMGMQRDPDQ